MKTNIIEFKRDIKTGFYFVPVDGIYIFNIKGMPNRFHRIMQKIFFGFEWVTEKQYKDGLK